MNRTYLKTQMELSEVLIEVIDNYYNGTVEEKESMENIKEIAQRNKDLLFVADGYGAIIAHKLGKKRMRVLKGALE